MRLRMLGVTGFRNLADTRVELPVEGVALLGDNAQGKSNLLEAVYYLEALRSFRGSREDQMIRFGEDLLRVVGRLEPPDEGGPRAAETDPTARRADGPTVRTPPGPPPVDIAVAYRRSPKVKKVTVDGREVERLADGVGRVGAVIFTPDDVRIVTEGPQERRRFLNVLLSLNDPAYLAALQRFRQVLAQRNAALRDGAPASAVAAWDEGTVRWGSAVAAARAAWVRESRDAFRDHYRIVSDEPGARLEYEPGIPGLEDDADEEAIAGVFRRVLDGDRERERRRGTTLSGPQRDELRIHAIDAGEERDLRQFGSGGQRRTAALALRLLEAEAVRARRGREPLLLLDDVFAELDRGRSERVLELLDRTATGQVILTAPKESDVRFRRDHLPRWTIRDGVIHR